MISCAGSYQHRSNQGNTQITIQIIQIINCRYEILCRILPAQTQPRKHVLDRADFAAPKRQHELLLYTTQIRNPSSALKGLDHELQSESIVRPRRQTCQTAVCLCWVMLRVCDGSNEAECQRITCTLSVRSLHSEHAIQGAQKLPDNVLGALGCAVRLWLCWSTRRCKLAVLQQLCTIVCTYALSGVDEKKREHGASPATMSALKLQTNQRVGIFSEEKEKRKKSTTIFFFGYF